MHVGMVEIDGSQRELHFTDGTESSSLLVCTALEKHLYLVLSFELYFVVMVVDENAPKSEI